MRKRVISFLISLVLLTGLLSLYSLPVLAAEVHLSGKYKSVGWTLDSNVTLYDGTKGMKLVIGKVGEIGSTDVGNGFNNYTSEIEEIEFIEGMTTIPEDFFVSNNLEKLKCLIIPSSVTWVGARAFSCTKSGKVRLVGGQNIEKIDLNGFKNLDFSDQILYFPKAERVDFEEVKAAAVILPAVKTVEQEAFYNSNIGVIKLGSALKKISATRPFYGASVDKLYLPASLESIGITAFKNAKALGHIYYEGSKSDWINIGGDSLVSTTATRMHFDSAYSVTPTLSGSVSIPSKGFEGKKLTVDTSQVSATLNGETIPVSCFKYQWQRQGSRNGWIDISGATSSTYYTQDNDYYKYVRVQVSVDGYDGMLTSGLCYCLDGIALDSSRFPDEKFRNYMNNNYDKDSDGWLNGKEIKNVINIDVGGEKTITSLAGIERLEYLESLVASSNSLTTVNLESNKNLKYLDLSDNKLETLDVSKNTELEKLYASRNGLESIKLGTKDKLTELKVDENELESIDVTGLPVLKLLEVSGNKLHELDVSKNTNLVSLYARENYLTSIDVSDIGTSLEYLDVSANDIQSLDLSKNRFLVYLSVYGNNLSEIDISSCLLLLNAYVEGVEVHCTNKFGLDYISYDDYDHCLKVSEETKIITDHAKLKYRAYVQKKGWLSWQTAVIGTETNKTRYAGTTDNLRMETIQMQLSGVDGAIKYRAYVQKDGWTQWATTVDTSTYAGTKGQSKRVEMIQLKAFDLLPHFYDIYYRTYCEKFGWLGWASIGEKSGSAGYARKLAAFQVQLVPKGKDFDKGKAKSFYDKAKDGAR